MAFLPSPQGKKIFGFIRMVVSPRVNTCWVFATIEFIVDAKVCGKKNYLDKRKSAIYIYIYINMG